LNLKACNISSVETEYAVVRDIDEGGIICYLVEGKS
jgi:hypothetical protein